MYFIFFNTLVIALHTLLIEGGNFHDFDSSFERIHYRCRTKVYPLFVERVSVPDDKVRWDSAWPEYDPPCFTALSTIGQPWADPDPKDKCFNPRWNSEDEQLNRRSYVGVYNISGGRPINPIGRTGLRGRGVLGRWGPNHAADSVVTRWKLNEMGELVLNKITEKPILQMIAIQKKSGEWGIPGGMINPGETATAASKREFFEEVLAYDFITNNTFRLDLLNKFFNKGIEIYKGYVDDPRNTDNAWVETVAFHYHDTNGKLFHTLKLEAGDDACNVKWMDVDQNIQLYSAHQKFVYAMTYRLNAHF